MSQDRSCDGSLWETIKTRPTPCTAGAEDLLGRKNLEQRLLVVEPNIQILRRYRRSLLLRLEHAHRSAVEDHVHRPPRLGSRRSLNLRIGISVALSAYDP